MTTVHDCWEAIKSFFGAGDPRPQAPTLDQFGVQYMITVLYYWKWREDPDALGPWDSEPRKTWDAGGSLEDGYVSMWE